LSQAINKMIQEPIKTTASVAAVLVAMISAYFACQSARAANNSAAAAGKSAEANMAAVRAWIHVTDYELPLPGSLGKGSPVKVYFKNIGRTPATAGVYVTAQWEFLPANASPPRLSCPTNGQPALTGAAGPDATDSKGNSVSIWNTVQLNQAQIQALADHTAGLAVSGCLRYQTVFAGPGMTEFCTVFYQSRDGRNLPCADGSEFLR